MSDDRIPINVDVDLSSPRTYAKWDGATFEELLNDWVALSAALLAGGPVARNLAGLHRALDSHPVVSDSVVRDGVRRLIGMRAFEGRP